MGERLALAERSAGIAPSRALETRGQQGDREAHEVHAGLGNQARLRLLNGGAVQLRLIVNAPGDEYEQEAERMAAVVTADSPFERYRSPAEAAAPVALRAMGKGEPEEPKKKKEEDEKPPKPAAVQRKGSSAAEPGIVPPSVEAGIATMSTGGDPLSKESRTYFEPRFGYDLGNVRIHSGSDAAQAAKAIDAQAFTVGQHIFFGSGAFDPGSGQGRALLAHELTHTIQQQPEHARTMKRAPRRVQRDVLDSITSTAGAGIDWVLVKVKEKVQKIPGYELLTVALGRDPITNTVVERNARNLVHAVLIITPDGEAIFKDLEESKTIEKTAQWLDDQVAKLDLTWEKIKALFERAKDSFSLTDLVDWEGAFEKVIRIFGPTLTRVKDFAVAVGLKLFEALKAKVLQKLSDWAHKQKGFRLLTFVLGRDPFTDEVVERTAKNFVRAVLELVPNGEQIYQNLEKSGKIDETVAFLEVEIAKLDLTWDKIKALFRKVWDVLSAKDLLDPFGIIDKVQPILEAPAIRVINFAIAVGKKVLQFIFEGIMALAGPMGQQVAAIVMKASDTFHLIAEDPIRFLNNLIEAAKRGFEQFGKNIWEHLKQGIIAWLVGALEGAGIKLPEKWDLAGIVDLVLQILGITYAKMRAKLVKVIGEEKVALIEKVFDFVYTLVTKGLAAAWEKIVEAVGNLWDMVIGGIKDFAVTKIVTAAITKLATMFNPVGAVIQAIIGIYNTIAFFVERIKQIIALVEAIVDSISNIALGKLEQAANYVERTLARTIPVILGFLARLVGLGDVSGAIKKVITTIQEKVDNAIDKMIEWIVEKAKAIFGAVKKAVGKLKAWWEAKVHFKTEEGEEHDVLFEGKGADAELVVQTSPIKVTKYLSDWEEDIGEMSGDDKSTQETAHKSASDKRDEVKETQKELDKLGEDDDKEEERQKLFETLTTKLGGLADALSKRKVAPGGPLPPPVLPPFTDGVLATSFEAEFIDNSLVGTGTEPGSQVPHSWDVITSKGLSANADWVRMHLLTAQLGGKGMDSNLVPASRATNTIFRDAVELPARDALQGKNPKYKEKAIWYAVDVSFHANTDTHKDGFPSKVKMSWAGYEWDKKSKNWKAKKAESDQKAQDSPPLPDLKGGSKLDINHEGRYRVSDVLGVHESFARLIVDNGPYTSGTNLKDKLNALPQRETIPEFVSLRDQAVSVAKDPERVEFK